MLGHLPDPANVAFPSALILFIFESYKYMLIVILNQSYVSFERTKLFLERVFYLKTFNLI